MEIAVISGKGGTGKSTITAALISQLNNIVAVDCDVDASNLHLLLHPTKEGEEAYVSGFGAVIDPELCTGCGVCLEYCRFEALEERGDKVVVDSLACEGCFLCSRVCPEKAIEMVPEDDSRIYHGSFDRGKMVYGRLAPGEENSGKMINRLREIAKELAKKEEIELIVLDGPPGISCPVISTVTGIDRVVIVTEPTVSGLSDLKRTVSLVRNFNVEIFVLVNKWDLNRDVTEKIEEWCKEEKIKSLGRLPFDNVVVEAMVAGKSVIEYAPESQFSKAILSITHIFD